MSKKAAIVTALAAANAALAAAGPEDHLGDLCWWDLVSGWARPAADVRAAWTAAGLDPDADFPSVPDAETAFIRSVARVSRAAAHHDCVLEPCAAPAGTVSALRRVAVVQMTAGETSVDGRTIGVVAFDDIAGVATLEQADAHGLAAAVVAGVADFSGRYTVSDLRDAMKAVFDRWAATPCRQAPPHIVYWMPAPGADVLRRLRGAVGAVGAGRIHVSPMLRNADSLEAAGAAASDGMEARLAEFAEQVAAWETKAPRASTIERRIAEAEALRATGALYRTILGTAAESVDAKIDALQAGMRRVLGLVDAPAAVAE